MRKYLGALRAVGRANLTWLGPEKVIGGNFPCKLRYNCFLLRGKNMDPPARLDSVKTCRFLIGQEPKINSPSGHDGVFGS